MMDQCSDIEFERLVRPLPSTSPIPTVSPRAFPSVPAPAPASTPVASPTSVCSKHHDNQYSPDNGYLRDRDRGRAAVFGLSGSSRHDNRAYHAGDTDRSPYERSSPPVLRADRQWPYEPQHYANFLSYLSTLPPDIKMDQLSKELDDYLSSNHSPGTANGVCLDFVRDTRKVIGALAVIGDRLDGRHGDVPSDSYSQGQVQDQDQSQGASNRAYGNDDEQSSIRVLRQVDDAPQSARSVPHQSTTTTRRQRSSSFLTAATVYTDPQLHLPQARIPAAEAAAPPAMYTDAMFDDAMFEPISSESQSLPRYVDESRRAGPCQEDGLSDHVER